MMESHVLPGFTEQHKLKWMGWQTTQENPKGNTVHFPHRPSHARLSSPHSWEMHCKKKIHLTTYYTFKSHSSSNNNTIKVKTVSSPVSVQFHKAILEIALLAQDDIIWPKTTSWNFYRKKTKWSHSTGRFLSLGIIRFSNSLQIMFGRGCFFLVLVLFCLCGIFFCRAERQIVGMYTNGHHTYKQTYKWSLNITIRNATLIIQIIHWLRENKRFMSG